MTLVVDTLELYGGVSYVSTLFEAKTLAAGASAVSDVINIAQETYSIHVSADFGASGALTITALIENSDPEADGLTPDGYANICTDITSEGVYSFSLPPGVYRRLKITNTGGNSVTTSIVLAAQGRDRGEKGDPGAAAPSVMFRPYGGYIQWYDFDAAVWRNLTSENWSSENLALVAGSIADVNVTSANIADVTTVAGIDSEVTTVAGVAANVTTVAGMAANVATVAGIDSEVTTVAGMAANVATVAGSASNVTTVAGIDSEVVTVGGSISDVTTVATDLSGDNKTGTVADWLNAGGSSADGVTFAQEGAGAVERTVTSKLREMVSVTDFGAVGDGVTDDTAAIQKAIDSGNEYIYVPDGVFNYSTTINITSKVRLFGHGTLNEAVLLDAGILVDSVDGVRIEGITFTGPETRAAWDAGGAVYRQVPKAFIKFDTCINGVVRDVISSGKRGAVWLSDCQKMQIDANRHNGFLGDITSPADDSNIYSCYRVEGGRENHLTNNEGFSCGSVVLCTLDSSHNMVSNTTGREAHDNFIYNSSGNYSSFVGGTFENAVRSGVKARGSGHTVSGFTIKGCGGGSPSISLTGNGLVPDAFGANGFGTTCYGNTIINSNGHAIYASAQDGLYPRDFIIANNTIENHIGTGEYSAILVVAERGVKVVNNIVRGSTADYALRIKGVEAGNRAFDYDVSGNTISNCVDGIRVEYVDDSLFNNNAVSSNSGYPMEFRLCDNNFITGNRASGANGIRLSSTLGKECFNNICVNNDVPDISGQAANVTALPISYEVGFWSPTYTTTGTDFTSVTHDAQSQGFYTKVGRLVTITGFIRTDAITVGGATGDVVVGGLPFSVSNGGTGAGCAVSVTGLQNFAGDYPSSGFLQRNESFIRLQYRTAANGDDSALAIADLGTGVNANGFAFNASYVTDL